MNFKNIFFLSILLFSFYADISAQFPYFKNYTINDGLISNKIYNIIEDRNGFIWFCTEQGVSRFDGIGFTNFTTKNGLPDNEVLSLFEDQIGRIWFNGFSKEPCYYFDGKIYNSDNDSFLMRIRKFKPKGMCISALVKKNNSIAFQIYQNNKKLFISKDAPDIQFKQNLHLTQLFQYLLYEKNNQYELSCILSKTKWKAGDTGRVTFVQSQPCIQNHSKAPTFHISWLNLKLSAVIQQSIKSNDSSTFFIDRKYKNVFCSDQYGVLVADSLYTIYNEDFSKQLENVKLPFNFERIFIDSKGNKWLGSFDNGFYFIRKNAPHSIELPEQKSKGILSLWNSNGRLIVGTETNGLLLINEKGQLEKIIKNPNINRVRGYGSNNYFHILGVDKGLYFMNNDFEGLRSIKEMSVKDIEYGDNGELLIGFSAYAAIIKNEKKDSLICLDGLRTTAICRHNENEIWLGGLNGIRSSVKDGSGYKSVDIKLNSKIDNSRIVDIKRDKRGNMWVATDQSGLFFCPIKGQIIHFTEDSTTNNKLMSDVCLQILIAEDNSIWLATTDGISVIRYHQNGKSLFNVLNYTVPEGMPARTINSIAFWQNKIVVCATNGIFYFDKFNRPAYETSETIITEIKVNSTISDRNNLTLPYNENNLLISYASSFINSGLVYNFQYRIKELNNQWIRTNTLEVPLLGLEPGSYTFEIAAINSQGLSGKITKLNFTIHTPWFRQWWFITLLISVVLFSVLYYYKLTKEKIVLSKDLTLLRLRILRAQMNPHFVFNALSNIKHLIKIKQLESAEGYIGTLSLIMRKSINYSGKEFIQLNKEINYTKDYVEIEKLRFAEKFRVDYQIELDEDDLQAIFVPPLIIQPLVENAIKHAFRGINYTGILTVKISIEDDKILWYTITDNGKGFDTSVTTAPNHGLSITKERIAILYRDIKKKGTLTVISNTEGESTGTSIVISLPIIKD